MGRGDLGRMADRLQVLLGHLEEYPAEVVGHQLADRRQKQAEGLDQALGLLRLGQLGGPERLADGLVEQLDGVGGDVAHGVVVTPGQVEKAGEGQAGLEEPQTGRHDAHVVGRVAGNPVVEPGHEEALPSHGFDERLRHPGTGGELLALAADHHAVTRDFAARAVELFDTHVRRPLRASDLPETEKAERLVEAFRSLLPAVTSLVAHHFSRVLLQVAQEHLESVGEPSEIAAAETEAGRRLEVAWP